MVMGRTLFSVALTPSLPGGGGAAFTNFRRHERDSNLAQRRTLGTLCRMHIKRFQRTVVASLLALSWGTLSFAQTGATLMLKPWAPEKLAEAEASATFLNKGHTDNNDADYQLSMYESMGRVRLFPGQEASPRFGYDFLKMDVHSNDPGLPSQLYDQSVSAGLFVGRYS